MNGETIHGSSSGFVNAHRRRAFQSSCKDLCTVKHKITKHRVTIFSAAVGHLLKQFQNTTVVFSTCAQNSSIAIKSGRNTFVSKVYTNLHKST